MSWSREMSNIHGSKLLLSIWWDQLDVVYYEQFKLTKTIMGDCYQLHLRHLIRALKKKRSLYKQRHDKVILQHDKARSHVAKQMKTYFIHRIYQTLPSLIIICYDRWLMAWLSSTFILMKMPKNGSTHGLSQKHVVFPWWNSNAARKMVKSRG